MPLTCEELMGFNLVEKIEEATVAPDLVDKFYLLWFDILGIDRFIKDSPSFPGSTDKIIRNELVSAIGATLSIEGTMLDKEEIEESFQKAQQGEPLKRKEQEAENSRKVYTFIQDFVSRNKGFQYSEQLIKQIHKYFTENMNYVSNVPGEYRGDFNVSFGDPRKNSLCRTRGEIEGAMKNFSVWLNSKKNGLLSSNTFVKAMMAHYYLAEIHPFVDGNGRTARALEALILNADGVNDYCFWSWANFWSSHKDQYLEHLHNIRMTLNPTDFILWGLKGYRDEIEIIKGKVLKKVKQLMFSDYIHYLLRNKKNEKIKINQRIFDTLQLLISSGRVPSKKFLSTPQVIALYRSVAESTRIRDFQKMGSADLIKIEKSDNEDFIEANFQILDHLRYNV
jgi:Fic family protein